ncbi:hypothetical protein HDU99_001986 [Rhizoclosmatium hyalinum]|nr:hypothetical protein HDU99_001986 [Rhizoclosmatium hyalinum]
MTTKNDLAAIIPLPQLVSQLLRPSERVSSVAEVWSVRASTGERKRRVAAVVLGSADDAALLVLRRSGDALVVVTLLGLSADVGLSLGQAKTDKALTLKLVSADKALVLLANSLGDIEPLLKDLRNRIREANPSNFEWLAYYRDQLDETGRKQTHVSNNPFILDDFSLNPANSRFIKENWIAAQQRIKESEFSSFSPIKVFTGTWNVNGQDPTESISPWFANANDADVFVLGFQELDLSTEIYLISDDTKQQHWTRLMERYLEKLGDKFYKVASKQLIGLFIVVYAKESFRSDISEVTVESVGTGLMGMGNKGGVSCRFRLKDSYLCFVNAHLAADTNQVDRRNQDFAEICKRTKYPLGATSFADVRDYLRHNPCVNSSVDLNAPAASPSTPNQYMTVGIFESDHLFFMGDLNYRITLSDTEAKVLLVDNELEKLLEHDQLNNEKRYQRVLHNFQEAGKLTFKPTYKFDVGTDEYDTSEKKRSPSWCDRIFYHVNPIQKDRRTDWIEPLWYRSTMDMRISDHKPVSAFFKVLIRTVDSTKLERLTDELMKELDRLENDALPKLEVEEDVVSFGDVKFMTPSTQCVHVKNTGKVVARFRFLPKDKEQLAAKPFYFMSPQTGTLFPGDVMKINLTILVRDVSIAAKLNFKNETLDDMFILHTDLGKDMFISAAATWLPSCFGNSLEVLYSIRQPIRFSGGVEGIMLIANHLASGKGKESLNAPAVSGEVKEMSDRAEENANTPKELWRLVDFIYRYGMDVDNLFKKAGDPYLVQYIAECLDTGAEFDIEALLLDSVDEAELTKNPDSASQEELHDVGADSPTSENLITLDIDLLLKSSSAAGGSGRESPTKHGHVLKLSKRKGRIAAVHAMAECLFLFLNGLVVPVLPPDMYLRTIKDGYLDNAEAQKIVAAIPSVHGHVFLYLASFLKEAVKTYSGQPELNAETISRVFAPLIVKKPATANVEFLKEVGGFGVDMRATMFLMQYVKQ